ncbi:MAG: hypothetical protein QNJ42_14025 [Crocosphaera sp.]|nr:hypothetical protein [Crocosphaera sp.]
MEIKDLNSTKQVLSILNLNHYHVIRAINKIEPALTELREAEKNLSEMIDVIESLQNETERQ